ncbi:uncharacterized protein LOC126967453 [Leptidea sinapis]|uniref:uncharacterized protein LOC126967453 n=1 Tax=Leptidea sinapis TaxID=189913 RepID=UPI002136914D|nr:uncharacterized protein LOC126967453 [Leptidea sinapis]
MEAQDKSELSERLQNILNNLTKCKFNYINGSNECSTLREINIKLESELKETRELEKSHRYQLLTSREMIANLQETVSHLAYLKRDVKKLKEEISSKDSAIVIIEREKETIRHKHDEVLSELQKEHDKRLQKLIDENERKVQQIQADSDTHVAQLTNLIEELRSKQKDMEREHRDQINVVVLEYEEKIQRSAAQVVQLQEQLSRESSITNATIHEYHRKLKEVEEKLKQSQFKEYLAQSTCPSQYENKVERPYSVEPNSSYSVETSAFGNQTSHMPINKGPAQNTLQVMYYDGKTRKNDKKSSFNITKKRKLYSGERLD